VGMYVQQLCLCALFFLFRDENDNAGAVPEGILMVILIFVTAGFHLVINASYDPLISALPLSVADKTYKPEGPPEVDNGRKSYDKRRDTVDSAPGASTSDSGPSQSVGEEKISPPDSKSDAHFDDRYFAQHADGKVDYGFAHPALTRPQRVIWIPEDTLGLGKEEVKTNEASDVLATTAGASMNEKGKVAVTAPPVDLNKF